MMFKKVEIWLLYLVIFLFLPFSAVFGFLVRQELIGFSKFGKISESALFISEIPVYLKRILTYKNPLLVNDRFPHLDNFNGNPDVNETYLLLSKYDGDKRQGLVELVDLTNFEVLHSWNPDINKFNSLVKKKDEFEKLTINANDSRARLIHPKLTEDGGLLFHLSGSPLIKIDKCSNLIFQNTHDQFHHAIETDLEGNIFVSSYKYPQALPVNKVGRDTKDNGGYLDDAIVKLSPSGKILFEKSVSQIFIDNDLGYLLFSTGTKDFEKDPIHLNDIQPVNFDGEFWEKGDVFLSLRNQSMIVLYRPETNQIIWKWVGPFSHQHDVDILDDYRISIFNNNAINVIGDKNILEGNNEVIIYNFKTNEHISYLKNSLIEKNVQTRTQGLSQILPNGDLFIEETNYARSLYFNADGSLRWTFLNRAKNQKTYNVGWSRILHEVNDIMNVKNFLKLKNNCDY